MDVPRGGAADVGHWRPLQYLMLDAGDECGCGAKLVTLFMIVPCSAVPVVQSAGIYTFYFLVMRHWEPLVALRAGIVGPVGCRDCGWAGRLGSKVFSPVDGHRGSLSIGQKGWL